ncbi:hypothetical protein HK097_000721 [Rhizophlyctis rosea]|uniref:Uncharacterized protein n=1 Tax=Rhizophlyctis rosea TaxID=64517 RepID=A0AAD5S585_9FUNG|nr:hypothetical protein HK097_000721 [Rhizophlyctis rosea]
MGLCTSKTHPKDTPTAAPPTKSNSKPKRWLQTEFASIPIQTLLLSEDDDRHKRLKAWCRSHPSSADLKLLEMLELGEAIFKRGNLYLQGKRMGDDEDLSRDRLATNAKPIIERFLTPGGAKAVHFVDADTVRKVREGGTLGTDGEGADLSDPKVFDGVVEELLRVFGESVAK